MHRALRACLAAVLISAGFAIAWYFRQDLQIACNRDDAGVPSCEVTDIRGWGRSRFAYPDGVLAGVRLERRENRDSDGSSTFTDHVALTHRDGREWVSDMQDKAEPVVAALNRYLANPNEKTLAASTSNSETKLILAAFFALTILAGFYSGWMMLWAALWAAICLSLIVRYLLG